MKSFLRKTTALFLCVAMVITMSVCALADYPTTVQTKAEAYVIYDADTGDVIMEKDMNTSRAPASITKIMTALIVCENVTDMDMQITFSQDAISEMTSDSSHLPGQMAMVGETMTMKDALYGMFLCSANECAAQLAISVAGNRENFAALMNAKAAELGCTGTHFVNAHGLDNPDHYTTPLDMAKIFAAALQNETFYEMATTVDYVIPATNMYPAERQCQMGHQMVNGMVEAEGVFAGKTGCTVNAGRTLVTAAKYNGKTVITVIMHSIEAEFYNDTLRLLEYAKGYCEGKYTSMTWTDVDKDFTVKVEKNLSVRDMPSKSASAIVGAKYTGDVVHVIGVWGDWGQIDVDGNLYYVSMDYLYDANGNKYSADGIAETTVAETTELQSTTVETETAVMETTTAAQNTTPAQSLHFDMTTAIIMIALIIVLAVLLIIFIIRRAISSQKKLYRKYYENDDSRYYEPDEEEEEEGISEDDEAELAMELEDYEDADDDDVDTVDDTETEPDTSSDAEDDYDDYDEDDYDADETLDEDGDETEDEEEPEEDDYDEDDDIEDEDED